MDDKEPGELPSDPDDSGPNDNLIASHSSDLTIASREEAFAELADLNDPAYNAGVDDGTIEDGGEATEAPAVVLVMVTHDPGDWLEETLASIEAQNYANLSVLIIDAASAIDPTPRIARVLPGAFVRRLEHNLGFGPTLDEVLGLVSGAAFYCFCHDDIALDPDAVQRLVEEAFRSNAGVVGPKLVAWENPEVLLQVGLSIDFTGSTASYADHGELDQEQHDAVRDVFVVPGACTLVRADLFEHLGGFDPDLDTFGEDVDLCWRAHLVGARVVVAPAARVRHREAILERRAQVDVERVRQAHRIRTMLVCYRKFTLLRVLPMSLLVSLAEATMHLAGGHRRAARAQFSGWLSALRHSRGIWAARKRVNAVREVADRDIRQLQTPTLARLTELWQSYRKDRGAVEISGLSAIEARAPRSLLPYGVVAIVALVLIGSRELLFGAIPPIGEFAHGPAAPSDYVQWWLHGWNPSGLGSSSPVPLVTGLLGVLGSIMFGSLGFARHIGILGMLPLGMWGAWRLAKPLGNVGQHRASLAALAVYAAVPVPYNALSQGRWAGLLAYAMAPWLFAALARAMHIEPFGQRHEPVGLTDLVDPEEGERPSNLLSRILGLGLLLGVLLLVAPAMLGVAGLVVLGLVIGSLIAGRIAGLGRLVITSLGATAVALVLQLPVLLGIFESGAQWETIAGVRAAHDGWLTLPEILRFESGAYGAAPLGFAFLVAALLPLVIGRDWRLAWATRAWGCVVVCLGVLWAGQQTWFPAALPGSEVLLAPAAVGVALAVALGVAAFDIDLPGYRFGWRQGAALVTGVAVVLGSLPMLSGAVGGRWRMPNGSISDSLTFVSDQRLKENFDVLWIGDPEVMPVAGWAYDDTLSYGVSHDALPTIAELWAPPSPQGSAVIADALGLAFDGETARLGRLLSTMNIRYVVVPEQVNPTPSRGPAHPLPERYVRALDNQLELSLVSINTSVRVYENTAWKPGLSLLPHMARGTDLTSALFRVEATPVLSRIDVRNGGTAKLPAAGLVALGVPVDSGWKLTVDGKPAKPVTIDGWQQGFSVATPGTVHVEHETPTSRWIWLAVQLGLWIVAIVAWRRSRAVQLAASPVAQGTPSEDVDHHLVQLTEFADGDVVPISVTNIDVEAFDETDRVAAGRDNTDPAMRRPTRNDPEPHPASRVAADDGEAPRDSDEAGTVDLSDDADIAAEAEAPVDDAGSDGAGPDGAGPDEAGDER